MKKILFLFMLVLCYACEEDKSIDPTLMPKATTTGENTLGCLIDGWVYTSPRFGSPAVTIGKDEKNIYVKISAKVGFNAGLHFVLVNPQQGVTCIYTNTWFAGKELGDGEAHISRMDGKVISGTFSGEGIKEGRFDINYYQVDEEGRGDYCFP